VKIGIIVYSQTGNSNYVAGIIQEELAKRGHQVDVERVEIEGKIPVEPEKFSITVAPDISPYDFIVFGSSVQAFSLNPAMVAYLEKLPSLNGKKTACFVTKRLPGKWTGGMQALGKIKDICESKGAVVKAEEIFSWNNKKRDQMIQRLAENIASSLFSMELHFK